jgi:hypothetical protein
MIREKYQEERNEIKLVLYPDGYQATFVDNNHINRDQNNRQEDYPHLVVTAGDFLEVINAIASFRAGFYTRGVNLNFDDSSNLIPVKEKETIELVVKKLETIAISHKNILESVKKIEKIVTDDSLYESKMLDDFR